MTLAIDEPTVNLRSDLCAAMRLLRRRLGGAGRWSEWKGARP